jgi:pSer/pThr/pTyr-binding forkhead associated (FHA) protein
MQRKRKVPTEGAEADYGTSPGVLPPHLSHASSSEVLEELDPVRVAEIRALAPVRHGALAEVPEGEVDAPFQLPRDQVFEKTLVLQDEVVLAVHETGKPVRAYKLPERRAVWIGRDPSRNTLVFSDPTLSGQHLRLVLGVDGTVDLVDSDSTNGTYVRDRKVKNCRLQPGERFRAGLIEFELKVLHRSPA